MWGQHTVRDEVKRAQEKEVEEGVSDESGSDSVDTDSSSSSSSSSSEEERRRKKKRRKCVVCDGVWMGGGVVGIVLPHVYID